LMAKEEVMTKQRCPFQVAALVVVCTVLLAGCASAPPRITIAQAEAIIASPDRSEADRTNDIRRKAAPLLAFIDVHPKMRALDISAGGGYTSELLARSVGAQGRVWSQIPPTAKDAPVGQRLAARMATPPMKNAAMVVRPFDDPVPPEIPAGSLDRVTLLFNYHDFGHMNVDRARVNRAVFAALKRGGTFVVGDHAGRPGTGISESNTLHRIEEAFMRAEIEAAGFRLIEEARFLRNPADPRTEPTARPAYPNDDFVLKFQKP
jgi:predicted methyltransferase